MATELTCKRNSRRYRGEIHPVFNLIYIGDGQAHVLMGPNGAGKSTLGRVIMVILPIRLPKVLFL